MGHITGFFVTVALLITLTTKVSAQSPQVPPQRSPPPPSRTVSERDPKTPAPDAGRVIGSTYTNDYFGLKLTIPQGWTVHDEETNKKIIEEGKNYVKANDARQQAEYDASIQRTLPLLTITSGSTIRSSTAGFQCMAERLPGAMTASNYTTGLKSLLMKTGRVELDRDVYTEMIDGVEFALIQTVMRFPEGATITQRYHITIKEGFALGFITSSANEEGAAALDRVIKSIRLTTLKTQ